MYQVIRGLRPLRPALVQTDGSFIAHKNLSRTACILTVNTVDYKRMATYFDHQSHVESEWCSILDGIILATAKGQGSIDLENDNLAVVNSIIHGHRPHKYYDYYWTILESIKDFEYVGLRWIPRELNRADELFRI